jgi:hypothetical protein
MTLDEVMADAAQQIDALIERQIQAFAHQIRSDLALTGPEDDDALDHPRDPDSPWRRSTVEEAVALQRERWRVCRDEGLARVRAQLIDDLASGQP